MHGWIDPFYEPADPALEPGHVWSDQPIYLPPRHGLKLERVDPQDDTQLDFKICGRTRDTFDHPPVHSMRLESTEAAVVARAKWNRPVIVLGGAGGTELRPGSTRHAETILVLPVYGGDQFDEHTRRRMAYYEFSNAFYLPAKQPLRFDEGFARLDHVQPVFQSHLRDHRGLKLTSDALDVLIEWFVVFSTGRAPADSIIVEYRREMLSGNDE